MPDLIEYVDPYARALNLDRVLAKVNEAAHLYSDPLTSPLISAIRQIQGTAPPFDENDRMLLWYIRYLSQLLARFMLDQSLEPLLQRPSRTHRWLYHRHIEQEVSTLGRISNDYLDIYTAFAMLELRMQGKLPAWEGILLVKERVQL